MDGLNVDSFDGLSVSLSGDGNTVASGAYNEDGSGNNEGIVRVHELDNGVWVQRGSTLIGGEPDEAFGESVALTPDGQSLIVGAASNDAAGVNAGAATIYDWDGNDYSLRGAPINGEAAEDRSGSAVSISDDGNTVAIGADSNDGQGTTSGHARVYQWTGTQWQQRGQDVDGNASIDRFGRGLALSADGMILAAGAPGGDSDTLLLCGYAKVYGFGFVDVSENEQSIGVQLYPNPTSNHFTLQFDQPINNATITIRDLTGKEVFAKAQVNGTEINIGGLALRGGLYFVQVISEESASTLELIVQPVR
jgi:hypothetical protein